MLDLCYSQSLVATDAVAVCRKHRSLRMLGLGGFTTLTTEQLRLIVALTGHVRASD